MSKVLLREVRPYVKLYYDNKNGITWVEDGSTGLTHSCHPNINTSWSVRGMKDKGYWGKEDVTIKSHGFIYNISRFYIDNKSEFDNIVANECMCTECIKRRNIK